MKNDELMVLGIVSIVAAIALFLIFTSPAMTSKSFHPPTELQPLLTGDVAYMVNGKSDSVTVIDMDAMVVVKEIPVGTGPHDLKISPEVL